MNKNSRNWKQDRDEIIFQLKSLCKIPILGTLYIVMFVFILPIRLVFGIVSIFIILIFGYKYFLKFENIYDKLTKPFFSILDL